MTLGETVDEILLVDAYPIEHIAGDADVQRAVDSTRNDVDARNFQGALRATNGSHGHDNSNAPPAGVACHRAKASA